MDLFARKNDASIATRVKAWATAAFAPDDDTTVMVTELACSEPGCPPRETVIALLSRAGNRQFKIHQPMAEITEEQVRALAG